MVLIHHTTSNKSFLEMSKKLQDEGIKNNKFMLQLHDKSLENIDPRSNELSPEARDKIIQECIINPYYFFREIAVVDRRPFYLNNSNLSLIYNIANGKDVIYSDFRQTLKTGSAISIFNYICNVGHLSITIASLFSYSVDMANLLKHKYMEQKHETPSYPRKQDIFISLSGAKFINNLSEVYSRTLDHFLKEEKEIYRPLIYLFDNYEMYPNAREIINQYNEIKTIYRQAIFIDSETNSKNEEFKSKALKWDNTMYDLNRAVFDTLVSSSENGFVHIDGLSKQPPVLQF